MFGKSEKECIISTIFTYIIENYWKLWIKFIFMESKFLRGLPQSHYERKLIDWFNCKEFGNLSGLCINLHRLYSHSNRQDCSCPENSIQNRFSGVYCCKPKEVRIYLRKFQKALEYLNCQPYPWYWSKPNARFSN